MIELTITPEQVELFRTCEKAALDAHVMAERAQQQFNLVYAAIVRGHGITDAKGYTLEGRTLTVTLPEPPREDA